MSSINCDQIKGSLIDMEHGVISHKLELDGLFYFNQNRIEIKEIVDQSGNLIKVLCVESK